MHIINKLLKTKSNIKDQVISCGTLKNQDLRPATLLKRDFETRVLL